MSLIPVLPCDIPQTLSKVKKSACRSSRCWKILLDVQERRWSIPEQIFLNLLLLKQELQLYSQTGAAWSLETRMKSHKTQCEAESIQAEFQVFLLDSWSDRIHILFVLTICFTFQVLKNCLLWKPFSKLWRTNPGFWASLHFSVSCATIRIMRQGWTPKNPQNCG